VTVDDAADRHEAARAERVVDGHRDRDQAGGPAVPVIEGVQVDAEAVEAEALSPCPLPRGERVNRGGG
jgi:hypothetical protein